jgi:uncharacterized membrane protein YhiD involved in acid resistance
MEEFGNYIFLILVVVALLSNMKKKKKSETKKTEEKKHYEQTTWQEFKPEVERKEFDKVAKAPINQPVKVHHENAYATYDTAGNDISELRIKKPVKVTIENSHHLVEEDRPEESGTIPLELDSPEAAKKAFLYSVIFERKY